MDQLVFDDDDDDQECGASVSPPPRSTGEPSDKNWFLLFAELSQPTHPGQRHILVHLLVDLLIKTNTIINTTSLQNFPQPTFCHLLNLKGISGSIH